MSKTPVTAWYWHNQDLIIHAYVQSRASKDEMLGLHENAVKIRLRAAAVDNRANDSLCRFLAKQFGISKTHIYILGGHNSRRKKIRVQTPRNLPSFIRRQDPA